ncbi:MAG TPA: hypothetical protein VGF51_11700 [Acidimicrobiales bacterium]
MVFEIWDSQENYEDFGKFLMPVLQEVGIVPSTQDIMHVENIEQ